MAGKHVVLHIGTMKSGTTYLQSALATNATALAAVGVDVVAGRFAEDRARPHHAARELRGTAPGTREWSRVVETVERSEAPTVVVSSELLSFLEPAGVEAVVRSLPGHDVTVVLGVRDQVSAIPAQWQTYTRNRGGAPFGSYLRQIADAEHRNRFAARMFFLAQDVPTIVDRWSRPGATRVVLLTVPPAGSPPDLTWKRFLEAAGLPDVPADLGGIAENRSLGYAACDYLRRLNRRLSEMPTPEYRRMVRLLVREVLSAVDDPDRPRLDRAGAIFAQERNAAIRALLARGVEHVGDPADLPLDLDLAAFPDEVARPDPDRVQACAHRVLEYAAERAGAPADAAGSTSDLVVAAAHHLWPGHAD